MTAPCLSQIMLTFGLRRSTSIHTHILPQSDAPPVDLSIRGIRWQIVTEWLEIV